MKNYFSKTIFLLLLLAVPVYSWSQTDKFFYKAAGSPVNPKVKASWNKYYTNQGVNDLCTQLSKAYPNLVSLEVIGKSYQGRDIVLLTISDKKAKDPSGKPGYWIDGNIHSVELQGTEMALYTAWYLCEMYADNEFIKKLLAEKTFYIAPTINPDGREFFTSQTVPPRSGLAPRDNDRDGLFDEDGFDDLNGDGEVSIMRIKNPSGTMRTDPSDPRKMIRVKPGETGEYDYLGIEGIDNDGDGLINEDTPGGYDGNRDWGFNWEPNYVQNGADKYPFTFPENQAVRDFVARHPNISGSQSFHNTGGMILRGPSIKGGGAEVYSRQDDEVINSIGEIGEKIIPGYRLLTIWKDMYTVWGGELDWMHGNGIFVFSNELWNPYLMFYDTANTDQYDFDRLLLFDDAFVPWQKVNHPQYGEIEIGGFKKNFGRLHPGFMLETDAHRNAAFCIYNANQLPVLEIKDISVKNIDGGLKEVSATVANTRAIPTHSASNMKFRIDHPVYVTLEGGSVIAAMIVNDKLLNNTTEQKKNPKRLEIKNIAGNSQVDLRWIVKGGSEFTVKVESEKGGNTSAKAK
ncbi:MAG TPA: M14 family metallopeptidase [Bacteroidales bacterium]|nr:M14 family metallopeptidase [Bacteroidales bacterium]